METDIDCGGDLCKPRCHTGKKCIQDSGGTMVTRQTRHGPNVGMPATLVFTNRNTIHTF